MSTPVFVLHDSAQNRKTPFQPSDPARIGMYVCGPTVYDDIHVGNARPLVVFDTVFRLLRHLYGNDAVTLVRNITDVDDKIIARAHTMGINTTALTQQTTARFQQDAEALHCLPPTQEPKATEFVPQMVALIEQLIANGHAYEVEGDVYFHVPTRPEYGTFSGHKLDELHAGARIATVDHKRNANDFALWKHAAEQPNWPSPWGNGRPGWHIECSAMSRELLGASFDLHAGGQDLIFPHHENEIAQSCCADPQSTFAKYWMHNGYVLVDGEKMAKSAGNFTTVRAAIGETADASRTARGRALRWVLLQSHYRQPLNYKHEKLAAAMKTLRRLDQRVENASPLAPVPPAAINDAINDAMDSEFLQALCDDLNTPRALARLQQLDDPKAMRACLQVLGLSATAIGVSETKQNNTDSPQIRWENLAPPHPDTEIARMVTQRLAARAAKDFATADRLRDALLAKGITMEDGPDYVTISKGH